MQTTRILERILISIPVIIGIGIIIFLIMRLTPGDPVDIMMGQAGHVSEREVELLREQWHLDEPLIIQLGHFLKDLFRGDLGISFTKSRPVLDLIKQTLPATIELALFAAFFALLVSIPIGVISAIKQNSLLDRISMAGAFFGICMPIFWLGIILIIIFSINLGILPTYGRIGHDIQLQHITGFYILDSILTGNWSALSSSLKHLIMPAVTLGFPTAAMVARVMRSSMLEVLRNDYVVMARAKGLKESVVIVKHAMRNAMIPTVTVIGLELGMLLGGNMIVETVFSWPGLGRLVVSSIFVRDYPLVQGVVMVYAFTFVFANLVVDILYTYINPKIAI
jgi:ABC-type dipeptide/oligopeptide/nickel transport system permease component